MAAAEARGREGGRKKAHTPQQIQGMMEMLASGKTKVEVCEMFDVARATLYLVIRQTLNSLTAAFLFYKKRTCKPADSPDNDLWSKTRKYNTIIRK
ncbi:helix-turn-helix domain-containing protein [Bacillus cereus]|uniref:helix-turn-helix domain-containing protein n=1 Tax=Bacillus cereus TaxID=1396 RepID=UPI000B2245A0|nr:helix-turn-helix domain-containing protein [Bacillus cereus]